MRRLLDRRGRGRGRGRGSGSGSGCSAAVASGLVSRGQGLGGLEALLERVEGERGQVHEATRTCAHDQNKKEIIEKEIEKEIVKAQKEISDLKKNSISDIQTISENITSNIIETISGDKLNESSIKAAVEDISKKNLGKYL